MRMKSLFIFSFVLASTFSFLKPIAHAENKEGCVLDFQSLILTPLTPEVTAQHRVEVRAFLEDVTNKIFLQLQPIKPIEISLDSYFSFLDYDDLARKITVSIDAPKHILAPKKGITPFFGSKVRFTNKGILVNAYASSIIDSYFKKIFFREFVGKKTKNQKTDEFPLNEYHSMVRPYEDLLSELAVALYFGDPKAVLKMVKASSIRKIGRLRTWFQFNGVFDLSVQDAIRTYAFDYDISKNTFFGKGWFHYASEVFVYQRPEIWKLYQKEKTEGVSPSMFMRKMFEVCKDEIQARLDANDFRGFVLRRQEEKLPSNTEVVMELNKSFAARLAQVNFKENEN